MARPLGLVSNAEQPQRTAARVGSGSGVLALSPVLPDTRVQLSAAVHRLFKNICRLLVVRHASQEASLRNSLSC